MKIQCQTCQQILPKTAVMCPNCGGRSFAPIADNSVNQNLSNGNPNFAQTNFDQPTTQPQNINAWQTNNQNINHNTYQNPTAQPVYQNQTTTTYAEPIPQYVQQNAQPYYTEQPNYTEQLAQQPIEQYSSTEYQPVATQPNLPTPRRKLASSMQYAGFVRRGFAFAFDVVLVGLLLALAHQFLLPIVGKQMGIRAFDEQSLAIIGVVFYFFYMAFFSCLPRQGTIGKIIMGLWVFGMQGQRINLFQALFRELLKIVVFPFFFIMWFTDRKQTLHDLMARTVVLYDPS